DGDLAARHENRAGEAGPGRVGGGAGAGVAGRRADHRLGADPGGHADGHRHAAVLERAGRVGPLDLEVHLAAGTGGQDRRGCCDRQPVPVLGDHPAPLVVSDLLGHHSSSPSTRITLATARTTGSASSSRTVAASAASRAVCVTMTSWASAPRLAWRTASMETSCRAYASATGASTPGLSSTSRETW